MRHSLLVGFSSLAFCAASPTPAPFAQTAVQDIYQGDGWTLATRADFYSRDQGSRMIPWAWLNALTQPNGQPFAGDALGRYGYLPNPDNALGLPVGFSTSGPTGIETVGMTCSACHTRQITVAGQAWRIDGGPALVDFQALLADLDSAVGAVLASDAAFAPFAASVLASPAPDPDDVLTLRQDVGAWYLRFHTIISLSLPDTPWGLGRLDAIGMIFNRVTGLDIGPPPSFIIADNIHKADAPARYPFLWNASRQDKTQWPGFAANGSDVLALARNLGEVFGVFAIYQPQKIGDFVDYVANNSANFEGLEKLEKLIKLIQPPPWQWTLDSSLANQGKDIFYRKAADGGCAECHDSGPGPQRFPFEQTLKTPITDAGTDTRELGVLDWTVKTGALQGGYAFATPRPLGETDTAFNTLATSVVGSIVGHAFFGGLNGALAHIPLPQMQPGATAALLARHLPRQLRELESAFRSQAIIAGEALSARPQGLAPAAVGARPAPYESRVMNGIWAAAPYLHNGAVPTLAELLKPAAQRVAAFKVGPAYDIDTVGLAVDQPSPLATLRQTTDCSDVNSGNSRCGHEFGTSLTDSEKKALLEYLKSL